MGPILIVGAGPTGLAGALFLAVQGVRCRIVDKASEPTTLSKALVCNPRTLELLEPTGVTAKVLAEGRPVHRFELRKGDEVLLGMTPEALETRFPLTVIAQARTEALLTEALAGYGVHVERGVEFESLSQVEGGVTVVLAHADGRRETVETPILFAADGAHSRIRHALNLDFPGTAFPEPWKLADIRLQAPVEGPQVFGQFIPHGLVFCAAFAPDHWRIITTSGEPTEHLPPGGVLKEVVWASDFHISHRIAEKLTVGRVMLGGDAAHLHSPVGARGMNLGIEDGYVFAHITKNALEGPRDKLQERLEDYHRLRHPVDKAVVRKIEAISRIARGEGLWSVVREVAPHLAEQIPMLRQVMLETVAGMDHPVRLS
jgi:2-polyprenyl-6-methoxyphenol hydroxylase-like FAD-dependent oxidoreductase